MTIETQLTLILAIVLLGLAWTLSLVAHGIVRLARGPKPQENRRPNLDDALPGRPGVLRERGRRAISAAGALGIYVVATIATVATRAWKKLNQTRKHIPGSVTLGLVAPGPALTEVLRETSPDAVNKKDAVHKQAA